MNNNGVELLKDITTKEQAAKFGEKGFKENELDQEYYNDQKSVVYEACLELLDDLGQHKYAPGILSIKEIKDDESYEAGKDNYKKEVGEAAGIYAAMDLIEIKLSYSPTMQDCGNGITGDDIDPMDADTGFNISYEELKEGNDSCNKD